MVKHVTDSSFETEVLKADKPVLVDFYADWCGPCKMMGPIVNELSEAYEGKLIFCKCNVDECPQVSQTYGIMSIPTIRIFQKGVSSDPLVGVKPRPELEAELQKYIG
ncbi:MAG: thioredoxin [Lachnospiraceae bacterium]|nr:thioredoxin [Lachnospiraceae bacterium]